MITPAHNAYILDDICRSKFCPGQLKHADLSDFMLFQNGNKHTPYAYVYRDVSLLCSSEEKKGYGVFAARDLPKGMPVTFYAGQLYTEKHPHAKEHKKSEYVYEFHDGVHMVDGLWQDPQGPWWTRHGVGHLLNDNIHVDATGLETNAYFAEVEMVDRHTQQRVKRVVIVTLKDVARGEELLVSYSLGYWLYRFQRKKTAACNDLGESSRQWLYNMHHLVQDFITRMHGHGRRPSGVPSPEDALCRDLKALAVSRPTGEIALPDGCDWQEPGESLPLIGDVRCVDMYDNPKFVPTCEHYDFYFETVVREGAFDLVFAFDNPHDMVCCDWQESVRGKGDASSDDEDAIMDGGEEMFGNGVHENSKECRLTVHYILDTFMNTWLHTQVSCWHCGRNIDFLSL